MRASVASVDRQILLGIAGALSGVVWQVVRKRRGEEIMKSIPSNIGISAFMVCGIAGFVASAAIKNLAPLFVLGLIGLYLMFAIKVADQWQRVAVLRLGKYIG